MGEINFLFSLIVDEAGWQNAKMFFFFFYCVNRRERIEKIVDISGYW